MGVADRLALCARGLEDCVETEFFSKPREEVGVIGLVMGLDVAESLWSFDRIFFRKPSVGIERDPGGGVVDRCCRRGCARRTADWSGRQWRTARRGR